MRSLRFDLLETLNAVVTAGGFSAAAEHLHLTQPAVSLQIRQLEERVGLPLVERLGRRVQATAAGEALLVHAARLRQEMDSALDTMRKFREGSVGRVRLGTGGAASIYVLPPLLKALRAEHPNLDIVGEIGNTRSVLQAIIGGRLDLGLVTLPVSHPDLAVTPLFPEPMVAVLPVDEEAGMELGPADLIAHPLVLFASRGLIRTIVDGWFLSVGLRPHPVMEVDNVEAIKRLVEAGIGWTVLPAVTVSDEVAQGRLATRPLSPPLERWLGLVHRRDKQPDTGFTLMCDRLLSLRAQPGERG